MKFSSCTANSRNTGPAGRAPNSNESVAGITETPVYRKCCRYN
jgi:hypothetical protein